VDFADLTAAEAEEISALFRDTFAASEGAAEGALIGGLARRLMTETPEADLHAFAAMAEDGFAGAIIFSRMTYSEDPRQVFVMGPVAVATDRQGQGVGQALIRHGLAALAARGVDVALTYGDPAYYGRFGFRPITTEIAAAPFALQFPEGWLGQSLDGRVLEPLAGAARCVPALDDPAFW
jgi:predicted N-acetyltransferase YhbS